MTITKTRVFYVLAAACALAVAADARERGFISKGMLAPGFS